MIIIKRIALVFGCIGLASCDQFLANFRVVNETDQTLELVTLRLGESERSLGNIPPRSEEVFRGFIRGEGAAFMTYQFKGKRVAIETCYQTAGMPLKGTIRIRNKAFERICA